MNEQLCEMFCRHIKCPIDIALLHFRVRWQAHISGEDKDKDTRNGILWQTEVLMNVSNVSMKEVSNNKTKSDSVWPLYLFSTKSRWAAV